MKMADVGHGTRSRSAESCHIVSTPPPAQQPRTQPVCAPPGRPASWTARWWCRLPAWLLHRSCSWFSYPLARNRFDLVAPLPVRLLLEQASDAFREGGRAGFLDRCNGGGHLALKAGLAQKALGGRDADLCRGAVFPLRLKHVCPRGVLLLGAPLSFRTRRVPP